MRIIKYDKNGSVYLRKCDYTGKILFSEGIYPNGEKNDK